MLRANTQSINNGQSVSSPQIMSMVHQHLAHYFVRSLREGRIGNVQGMADVKAALRSEDGRAFEAAMYCLPPEQIDRLRGFKNFPKAIHRVINNLLDDFAYVGERAGLFSAYHLATTALEFGFAWDKRNGSNTNYLIENLIKQRQGSFAARLVTLSIQNGLRLPERLILSSLVVAAKEARRPTHLMNYAHLALVAAERGMINFADPKVNRVYDVVLALLGTPSNLGSRVNQVYEDKSDIIDLGRRLKLAGEIGIAALEGGVRFDVQRSERRINMLARALVTGSAKLDCTAEYLERRHKDGYLSRTKVRELQKEYRIGTQSFGLRIPNRNADPQVLRKEVDVMLGMSLELLNQSIVWTNGSSRVLERHHIEPSTINNLLDGFAQYANDLCDYDIVKLSDLVQKASFVPRIAEKLYSHSITGICERIAWERSRNGERAIIDICASVVAVGKLPSSAVLEYTIDCVRDEIALLETSLADFQDLREESKEQLLDAIEFREIARRACYVRKTFDNKEAYAMALDAYEDANESLNRSVEAAFNIRELLARDQQALQLLEASFEIPRHHHARKLPFYQQELRGGLEPLNGDGPRKEYRNNFLGLQDLSNLLTSEDSTAG